MKRDRIELRPHLFLRRTHQFAMEWRAHGKHHGAARSGGFSSFNGALDRPAVTRDHNLIGRVEIGRADDFTLRRIGKNFIQLAFREPQDRCHRTHSNRNRLLHELAALAYQTDRILKIKRARRD